MCSRFTRRFRAHQFLECMPVLRGYRATVEDAEPSYNISPSQDVLIARLGPSGQQLEIRPVRWGLVPAWEDAPRFPFATFNAHVESAPSNPAFHEAFARRRCLVLADGWYEWRAQNVQQQAFLFQEDGARPFAFAGLWERWVRAGGQTIESCTILTVPATPYAAQVHVRMPVRLAEADYRAWLGPESDDSTHALQILRHTQPPRVTAAPVSAAVDDSRSNGAELVAPIGPVLGSAA